MGRPVHPNGPPANAGRATKAGRFVTIEGKPVFVGGPGAGGGGTSSSMNITGAIGTAKLEQVYTEGIPDRNWREASEDLRSEVKQEIISKLADDSGLSESQVDSAIGNWSQTSCDDDLLALRIQESAGQMSGADIPEFITSKLVGAEDWDIGKTTPHERLFGKRKALAPEERERLLQSMYVRTQQQLASAGFKPDDTIKLYRGVRFAQAAVTDVKDGSKIQISSNPLSSWSLGRDVARRFATPEAGGTTGLVLEMEISVRSIISTARTGFGCLSEGEVVVIGANGTAKAVQVREAGSYF